MAESSSWNTEQNRRSSANDTTCPSQKKYKVETDIANCFPSVYSHAVPWAAVGFAQAKKDKNDKAKWFNQLDSKVCWCKRNETNGVAIGPATSNIVVEAILAKVDDEMSNTHKFEFERYIDDYTAYCDTEEDAQRFLRLLGIELEKYKFLLNVRKTKIQKLPEAPQANWISQLILSLPRSKRLTVYDTAAYLGLAMDLASHEPDGSVLKYAVTTLASKNLAPNAHEFLLEELLNLSFHSPNLIPLLRPLFRTAKAIPMFLLFKNYRKQLNVLLHRHACEHRSDAMCWLLFIMRQLGYQVSDDSASQIIVSNDCLAILSLYEAGDQKQKDSVVSFAKKLDKKDWYLLDSYWILLYELFGDGKLPNPYGKAETAFETMKKAKLLFFDASVAL